MKKILGFVVLAVTLALFSGTAMNEPLHTTENLRSERVVLPPATPDKGRMAQTDRRLFFEAGGASGILVFYDDARTKPATDYIEFFDLEGNLLLVSWIDRAGICQAAMDRGLLDAKNPKLEKVLVIVTMGTAL